MKTATYNEAKKELTITGLSGEVLININGEEIRAIGVNGQVILSNVENPETLTVREISEIEDVSIL